MVVHYTTATPDSLLAQICKNGNPFRKVYKLGSTLPLPVHCTTASPVLGPDLKNRQKLQGDCHGLVKLAALQQKKPMRQGIEATQQWLRPRLPIPLWDHAHMHVQSHEEYTVRLNVN